MVASDGSEGDSFGNAVAVSENYTLIGARYDDDYGISSGSAYLINLAGPPLTVNFDLAGKATRSGGAELIQTIVGGNAAVAPEILVDTGWFFAGWDMDFSRIVKNVTVSALYLEEVSITFDLGDQGTLLSGDLFQALPKGQPATAPSISVADGWAFWEWDTDFSSVEQDITVTAVYVPLYEVTFDLGDYGNLVSGDLVQQVHEGYSAVTPDFWVDEGWIFTGWDQSYQTVTNEMTVTAQFESTDSLGITEVKFSASDAAIGDNFGSAVAIDRDTAVVGVPYDDDDGVYSGSAYIYFRENGVWSEELKIKASDAEPQDYFGYSVDVSGDTIVVGAYGDDDNDFSSGSVYVFVRENGDWIEQAKLLASDGALFDRFGYQVAISGNTIVVGAYLDDDKGSDSGSAYVYQRKNGVWFEQSKLTANYSASNAAFGKSVAISGNTIVVGAPKEGSFFSRLGPGRAHVFVREADNWTHHSRLTASDGAPGDLFGDVAVSGDTIVVGAQKNYNSGIRTGSAYVFVRQNDTWIEETQLIASDGKSGDDFGVPNLDGDKIIISARGDDDNGSQSGSAYLFSRQNGSWTEQSKLTASDGTESSSFGTAGISGSTVIVGARGDNEGGSAYFIDLAGPPLTVTFDLGEHGTRTGGGSISQTIIGGSAAVTPEFSVEEGWIFIGWDRDFSRVVTDLVVNAQYAPGFVVTFDLGVHGTLISGALMQTVAGGFAATAPTFTVADGWSFDQWSSDFSSVDQDITVEATYLPAYTVTFDLGSHGTLLSGDLIQKVAQGSAAITPEISVTEEWAFTGWDNEFHDVTTALTVNAQYSARTLTGILSTELIEDDAERQRSYAVAVSVSGDTAVIGEPLNGGSAHIFVKEDGTWYRQARLNAPDAPNSNRFASELAVSGSTLVVGDYLDGETTSSTGCVYVFVRENGVWAEEAKMTASDGNPLKYYGSAVAISGDTMVVGAFSDDTFGSESGSAYVYKRENGVWTEQGKLTASDASSGDRFGGSVSISSDRLVIGAGGNGPSGSCYVFVRENGVWSEEAKIVPNDSNTSSGFGRSVSISGDTFVVGESGNPYTNGFPGNVYVYVREAGIWTQQAKLDIEGFGYLGRPDDFFYFWASPNVGLSGDILVFSAFAYTTLGGNTDASISRTFLYDRVDGVWTKRTELTMNSTSRDRTSSHVSVSGDVALVGTNSAVLEHDYIFDTAFIFDLGVAPFSVNFDLNAKGTHVGGGDLTQLVKANTPALAPIVSPNFGWMFQDWDIDFSSITTDLTVNAEYSDATDSDGDQLWDGWEAKYLATTGFSNGTTDSDGDGEMDMHEFISGSDPMDGTDRFQVMTQAVSPVDGQITLRFRTNDDIGGRRYRIYYTDNLQSDNWTPHSMGDFAPDVGDFTEKRFVAPGLEDAYFFKVEAFILE